MHAHQHHHATHAKCPTRGELTALLEGSLDPDQECSISLHLDACTDCRQALENTAGEASWWSEVQTFLAASPRLHSVARKLEASSTEDAEHDRSEEAFAAEIAAEIKRWLGPTDDPQSLGRIGRFEVTGVVGAGSMGVVLKALEPQLKRYVAIKVLLPLLAHNGAARRRFHREARSAAAVNHPHVVPIYGVDEYQGLPYLVMQYVPGESLADRIEAHGPLATPEVVRIALQTARALAAAHEQGLVHRDIKPANILLENGIERVLVTDFGLARIADDASMTKSGVITGTPQFMSPEQASGKNVDVRSDLFSLGAVMYAMCTGHPPFRAATVFGLLKRICEDEPRPIRAINPEVPEWLDQFVRKLLAKDPADRFASAEEVAEYLTEELAFLQNPTGGSLPQRPWQVRMPTLRWNVLDRVRLDRLNTAAAAAIAVCVALMALPPEVSAPRADSAAAASTTAADWTSADVSLEALAAEIERLELQISPVAPPPPYFDDWASEARAVHAALDRLEQLEQRQQAAF